MLDAPALSLQNFGGVSDHIFQWQGEHCTVRHIIEHNIVFAKKPLAQVVNQFFLDPCFFQPSDQRPQCYLAEFQTMLYGNRGRVLYFVTLKQLMRHPRRIANHQHLALSGSHTLVDRIHNLVVPVEPSTWSKFYMHIVALGFTNDSLEVT